LAWASERDSSRLASLLAFWTKAVDFGQNMVQPRVVEAGELAAMAEGTISRRWLGPPGIQFS
jgi:hypothetical protein